MDTTLIKIPLLAFVCTIVQFSFLSFFGYFGWHPDLLFVLIFLFSFNAPRESFYLFSFWVGLFVDLLSTGRFGLITLSYEVAGIALFFYLRQFSFGILQKVIGFAALWFILKVAVLKLIGGGEIFLTKSLLDMLISSLFIFPALYISRTFFKNKEFGTKKGIQLKLGG
ncbi:rod shape-determining protein MreD [Patescibacteria group bacterium]|nr:rod shape-determining protein MreD [Patescibacteria group bacterium]